MKYLFAFLLFYISQLSAQNPYAALTYDSLVIYDYGAEILAKEPATNLIKNASGTYSLKEKPLKSIKLSVAEAKDFSVKIGQKASYGQGVASCYDPHFAAFYYKNGKAVEYVEICISCNRLYSSAEIKAKQQLPQTYDGEVYYLGDGMSKSFRKYLGALLIKYKFSHTPTGQSMFD